MRCGGQLGQSERGVVVWSAMLGPDTGPEKVGRSRAEMRGAGGLVTREAPVVKRGGGGG